MGSFTAGSVVLVRFPFSDLSQTKLRSAVVLAGRCVAKRFAGERTRLACSFRRPAGNIRARCYTDGLAITFDVIANPRANLVSLSTQSCIARRGINSLPKKFVSARTPKPARETRALPGGRRTRVFLRRCCGPRRLRVFEAGRLKLRPGRARYPTNSRSKSVIEVFGGDVTLRNNVCTFDRPTYDAPGNSRSPVRFVSVG